MLFETIGWAETLAVCASVEMVAETTLGKIMREAEFSLFSTVELAVELTGDEAGRGIVKLEAADIDALIAELSQYRSTMAPEVPRQLAKSTNVAGIRDPMWILRAPPGSTDRVLLVRHPGLGWLMFQLPVAEATRLGHALLPHRSQHTADEPQLGSHLN